MAENKRSRTAIICVKRVPKQLVENVLRDPYLFDKIEKCRMSLGGRNQEISLRLMTLKFDIITRTKTLLWALALCQVSDVGKKVRDFQIAETSTDCMQVIHGWKKLSGSCGKK